MKRPMPAALALAMMVGGMTPSCGFDRPFGTGSSQPTGSLMSDGGTLYLESGIPEPVRDELRRMGHNIATRPGSYGGYQAVMRDAVERVYYGASDSRRDGQAAGY